MTGKAKIIVSDLHMGAGFAPDNPLEDFDRDDKFAELLDGIVTESDAKEMDVELIANGDLFEFLQVPAVDTFDPRAVYPPERYHPTSEEASAKKMALIIAGHLTIFTALRGFINPEHPRRNITIIKGNHDVDLYWGAVQDSIRQAVKATGDRQGLLAFEERQVNRESIYVEHGNQYSETVNRLDNFELPLDPECPGELETPAGSVFVMDFINDLEREKWWVDSVKPITALIWYSFAIDFEFAARMLVHFLKVAPILVVGSFAEEETGSRAQMDELRQQLEDETQVAALGERYATDEAFRREFNARLGRVLRASAAPPEAVLSAFVDGAEEIGVTVSEQDVAELADAVLRQVAQTKIKEEHVQVVVFGHTHRPLCERLDGGMYLNSGTWVWWRDFAGMGLEDWKEFYAHPEDFCQPHYLPYVRVDYDEENRPQARLLDYAGQLAIECPAPPRCKFLAWLVELWEKLVEFIKMPDALSGR